MVFLYQFQASRAILGSGLDSTPADLLCTKGRQTSVQIVGMLTWVGLRKQYHTQYSGLVFALLYQVEVDELLLMRWKYCWVDAVEWKVEIQIKKENNVKYYPF